MAVVIQPTPNPNALKFVVGGHVATPTSYIAGRPADHPAAAALLALPGVASVFMSADFVTLSKTPDAFWDEITPAARRILEEHFSG
ncbi:MAG: NifU N-terminal domain-containing protein [Actinomycetota bacterium]